MRILSGIRPSGQLHLGHYLGAIQQWIHLQRDHEVFYMVADLHAITTPYEPKKNQQVIRETVADYVAAGLDPERAAIFIQSQVPEHVALMWVLSTITPIGDLQRMTQFKDKVRDGAPAAAGLFNYPILMAADILVYQAQRVPVGEDQVQHVELARTIARKFNRTFGDVFPEPQALLTEGKRVMSLKNPEKKMSKTGDEPLYLADEPGVIKKKLAKAVTATTGGGKNPGVANLLSLLQTFSRPEVAETFTAAEKNGTIKYAELKAQLAQDIAEHFADFRTKRKELLARPGQLTDILSDGVKRAQRVASATLNAVYEKTGLR